MTKIILTSISLLIMLPAVNAQKGINFNHTYPGGGRLLMTVDSSAKNVYYYNKFPNQPNTSFSYLPEVNNLSIQIYFRKIDSVQDYRYTILVDDKPIVVNKSINQEQLKDIIRKDDDFKDEVLRTTTLGVFPIKGKTITTLVYSIERPLDIEKSVFYGKPIPSAKIEVLAKRFATERGV
ncbi:hypothetical protein SAMN05421747_1482 [Parapedobacter composti]|uniref:Uncharacterized protein n=1 Tax=Parapedobacter composti TaxID=623281 RepID=A0A1I1MMV3_9SPHI|nr:hypothetical protein [Parapedobacter composti]SFC86797.1 hypothetical protein SAMN05421747_1482 [Parapedobacter composti]